MRSTLTHATALVLSATLSAVAPAQLPQWRLVEELRIGSDASEMTTFADVRGVIASADGKIFVLDATPQQIRVFDRAGKFLTLAARRGSGPGEISNANGMLLLRDTIWVNDPENSRWPAYSSTDGRYLRQINIPINSYGYIWQGRVDGEGRIAEPVYVERTDPATNRAVEEMRIRRVRTDGSPTETVGTIECDQRNRPTKTQFRGTTRTGGRASNTYVSIPFIARPMITLDGRAGYWCAPNDGYVLVHRLLAGNDTLHTIRMPYTRLAITAQERSSEIESAKKSLAGHLEIDADFSLIPNVHPVFDRLDVDDKGQLWARRVTAAGSPLQFDVYDQSGRAIAAVTTTLRLGRYIPLHVRGDTVYGVVRDADDVPYVVRARIVR